ncbi:Programmed cell death protein 2 [Cryptosporidium felis]|nr:Programmed cell death protein 2 [Cryptosporidium felis]
MRDTLLGFLEKPSNWGTLDPKYFPSKFGGRPAWLNPRNLPRYRDLQCSSCGSRMRFLLQVYAPLDNRDDLFHRSLFVFICTNCASSALVLRCQLPRKNEFYDFNPVPAPLHLENGDSRVQDSKLGKPLFTLICRVCGLPLECESGSLELEYSHEKCKKAGSKVDEAVFEEYILDIETCSEEEEGEEEEEEEEGEEEEMEGRSDGDSEFRAERVRDLSDHRSGESDKYGNFQFSDLGDREVRLQGEKQHFEILSQQCPDKKSSEYKLLQEYQNKFNESIDNVLDDSEMKAFGKLSSCNSGKDPVFDKFLKNSQKYPGHVIRYCYKGDPLWISDKNKPSELPPNCPICSSKRVFEFQIQPEIIVLGKLPDKVDFGVIAIYTCSENCQSNNYVEEFLHVQKNPY